MESSKTNNNVLRKAFVWNTAGSFVNAFQSVFILMVITRVSNLEEAGIFTLAFANANLFLNLGKYGMRNYQASDVAPRFGFGAYLRSRIITCVCMVVCGAAHLWYSAAANGYDSYKSLAVLLMILLKTIDAFEDVFDGSFQQSGRLDVAGKQMTARILVMIVTFIGTFVYTSNLIIASIVSMATSLVTFAIMLAYIRKKYHMPIAHIEAPDHSSLLLLGECLPLFIAAFLLFYIGNAPKYAIDSFLNDVAQAQYGFIAMPVFIVSLLAQFVYMPMIEPLSQMWAQRDCKMFGRIYAQQVGVILGITVVCTGGAALLGVPVLSILYHTDLGPYGMDLCILVLGGGFLALASLFTMGITIMRRQNMLIPGYAVISVAAWGLSNLLVPIMQIRGASLAYILCMTALAAYFCAVFAISLKRSS